MPELLIRIFRGMISERKEEPRAVVVDDGLEDDERETYESFRKVLNEGR